MKKVILVGAVIFALGGCASNGGSSMGGEANADTAKAAIAAASDSLKKAGKVDGVWRDAGKMLKKAEAAAGKKDYAKAVKLANKAKFEGDMGYKQAMAQKDAGPWEF